MWHTTQVRRHLGKELKAEAGKEIDSTPLTLALYFNMNPAFASVLLIKIKNILGVID